MLQTPDIDELPPPEQTNGGTAMKRLTLFLLCLLLSTASILGLTACNTQTTSDTFHFPQYDLPAVEESEVAYLLDPEFAVTEENVFDCIYDYFAAPSILYYTAVDVPYYETPFIKDKHAADFAEVFRDVPLTQISREDVRNFNVDFDFCNAIGFLTLYEYQGTTYIQFSRSKEFGEADSFFKATGMDLIPELLQAAESLEDDPEKSGPEMTYPEDSGIYDFYDDLPAIQESESAYLLDPDFTITADNFYRCLCDYFAAPAMLNFGPWHIDFDMKNPEKAVAFAEIFRDLTLTPTSDRVNLTTEEYRGSYWFTNAIGHLSLYSGENITYIAFFRDNGFVYDDAVSFTVEKNLVAELNLIGESLLDYVIDPPDEIPPATSSDLLLITPATPSDIVPTTPADLPPLTTASDLS